MVSRLARVAAAVTGVALLGACSSIGIKEHKGYVLDKELASTVQVGVDNMESVAKTLGRPTFIGQFNPNDWYYLSRDTTQFAFRNPRVTDQKLLHVRFDAAGNVIAVDRSGEERIAAVDPSGDKTATLGRKRSFFEELFGNIGTISQPGLPGSQPQ